MKIDREEPKVKDWIETVEASGCTVGELKPLSIQQRGNGELLFAYLEADVTAPEGYKLLPILFLRGHAVLVIVEVVNVKTGEERFLMVEQRRIAMGSMNLEFPAGMLDREVGNPAFVAVKELMEETGLSVNEQQLLPLCDRLLYSSPGACDEGIWFYGARIKLPHDEYQSLHGRIRINESENERIKVVLKSEVELLEECHSLQAMLGLKLFKEKFTSL